MRPRDNEQTIFAFFMTVIVCLFALAALCNFACADHGVYKVVTGSGAIGSAVAIETGQTERQHLLTTDHVLKGESSFAIEHKGQLLECEPVGFWEAYPERLLIMRTKAKAKLKNRVMRQKPVKAGENVYLLGYDHGRYTMRRGRVRDVQTLLKSYLQIEGVVSPGASGGAVIDAEGYLIGIIDSYAKEERSLAFASNIQAATGQFQNTVKVQWRCNPSGCYPIMRQQGRVIERGSYGLLGGGYERQYIPPQPVPDPISQPPRPQPQTVVPGGCVVDYDKLASQFMQQYGDQLRGEDGLPGVDGEPGRDGQTPQIDLDALANAITTKYADRIRGQRGERGNDGQQGPQGERGLIGVPDEDELAAVVDLWVERNIDKIEAFIDARTGDNSDLIRRIEALENREPSTGEPTDLTTVNNRLAKLEERNQRVLIIDGKTKNVLDDETYEPGEPIVLDIQRLIESVK